MDPGDGVVVVGMLMHIHQRNLAFPNAPGAVDGGGEESLLIRAWREVRVNYGQLIIPAVEISVLQAR